MAFDGATWNEAAPTNADLANEIDDYMRDIKIGVRSRMAIEHKWSASQTATGSDGCHTFLTLSTQTSAPGLVYGTATQAAAIWAGTDNSVNISDKTGVAYVLVKSAVGVVIANGTGTLGATPYITSGGGTVLLGAGTSGYVLTAAGAAAPVWAPVVGLGAWASKSNDTVYEATTDGFLLALLTASSELSNAYITGYTDGSNPPTTARAQCNACVYDSLFSGGPWKRASFCMPVKKGDYYKGTLTTVAGSVTATYYWIPLGS